MPITVGIVGTAKNTGKTTTTVALLRAFKRKKLKIGLTSIGYDGELWDNITGLSKPEILVPHGALVATASNCLASSKAQITPLTRLGIFTSLGEIVCGQVVSEGRLLVAGPNQISHLKKVKEWFIDHGAQMILIDGALNRLSPMVETDGIILAIGPSYSSDIKKIAEDVMYFELIFSQPLLSQAEADFGSFRDSVILSETGVVLDNYPAYLHNIDDVGSLMKHIAKAKYFYCPGVITLQCLRVLADTMFSEGMKFIFNDPVQLILSGDINYVGNAIRKIISKGGIIQYRRMLPLISITICPFYPDHHPEDGSYSPAFIDKNKLIEELNKLIKTEIYDVVEQGGENLAEKIENFTKD